LLYRTLIALQQLWPCSAARESGVRPYKSSHPTLALASSISSTTASCLFLAAQDSGVLSPFLVH
jgi:hypothetical protein